MSEQRAQTETRSVLFTDLVGSTELRVRLGEDGAEALRREHDALLTEVVHEHGGEVVKGLGDGIMAAFTSAADAAAAAVAIARATDLFSRRNPDRAFAVRVGLSAGDVTIESGDVFGVPVVEASRLCAAATGGEILAAELVRVLARGRGGMVFEPMGDLELKGLHDPVAACRIIWEPAEDSSVTDLAGGGAAPLPSPLGGGATGFIGREELLARLEATRAAVSTAGCRMVLLAGEPGVGKTRTAAELARRAHAQGALVLYGRCDEDLALPYQPMVEALDWYSGHVTDPVLGRLPGELVRMAPRLSASVAGLPAPVATDARSEEHLLFEATASWLVELARRGEVVFVLDDLHWATKPTLLLLLHVLRAGMEMGAEVRLMIVGTYRDTDIDRTHPLSGVLADLRRLPVVERFAIGGLNISEVLALIEAAAGHELDENIRRMAVAVYDETEGNPFFVAEVLRHLVETGAVRRVDDRWVVTDADDLAVPEGVRDVVGQRLSRLSDAANGLLSTASVIGRDINVELLAALSDATEEAMLDALDEAVRARLVEETGPDHYRFSHALVRTTLYEELSATRRRRLHRKVAEAIEKLRADDVAALAYHYLEAGPDGGDMSRAVRYTLVAGEQALAGRAPAQAEARFRQVLEVFDDLEMDDSPKRVAALCGLGEAQRDQSDQSYRTTLLGAARLSVEIGDTAQLVRAVLANTRGIISVVGKVDPERVEVAELALEAVGPASTSERALLLAYLAAELVFGEDHQRHLDLADEAEEIARSTGDPNLLAAVLVRTGFAEQSIARHERYDVRSAEGLLLADATGDPTLRVLARWFRSTALATAGDVQAVRSVTEEMIAISADASPTIQWVALMCKIRILGLEGRLDEAGDLVGRVLEVGQANGEPDAFAWVAAAFVGVEWARGRVAYLADSMAAFADEHPAAVTWRSGHAAGLAFAGRHDEAKAVIARYGIDADSGSDEPFLLLATFQMALCAYFLGDRALAEGCRRVLLRYEDCWGHYIIYLMGPARFALSLCEITVGDADEAVRHAERALEEVREKGCAGIAHHVGEALGLALLARDGPGDRARAREVLAQAESDSRAVGAEEHAEQIARTATLGRDPRVARSDA